MADLIATERSNIVAIANAVRNRTGETGDLTIGEIISSINNIESGGNTDIEDALIARTFSTYTNDRVKSVGSYAFYSYSSLTTVSFPACITIGEYAFSNCRSLTTVSFPACTTIGNNAFSGCRSITTASFPACTTIGNNAFRSCYDLTTASFPACTTIGNNAFNFCRSLTTVSFLATTIGEYAFYSCRSLTTVSFPATTIGGDAFRNCYNLTSLYLTGSSLCTLSNSNAFASTPIGGYSASVGTYGLIYVPASLLKQYKTATNWTYFSSYFRTIENGTAWGDTIVFTINNIEYQAKDGMTWAEWVNSEYNIGGFTVSSVGFIKDINGNNVAIGNTEVSNMEQIISNKAYMLLYNSGGDASEPE